ncbi:MAG: ferredoxin [Candidatus Wallbacteria bacterium]|nr:ferredoxin [Candidatus Wallbacteria bacterium]
MSVTVRKKPKVWIEPGCIVCRACEQICPEVFEVTEETCIVRPDADASDADTVREAAQACPVEVIRVG